MISFKRALQSGAIALALAGTAIGMTGTASAQGGYYNDPNRDGYNGQDGYYNGNPYSGDYNNQNGYYNNDPNRGYYNDRYDNGRYGRGRGNDALSILFGSIAFGYRDGYWDNGHRWHHWRHNRDYRDYRDHGGNYHGWNHDRDDDNGWLGR